MIDNERCHAAQNLALNRIYFLFFHFNHDCRSFVRFCLLLCELAEIQHWAAMCGEQTPNQYWESLRQCHSILNENNGREKWKKAPSNDWKTTMAKQWVTQLINFLMEKKTPYWKRWLTLSNTDVESTHTRTSCNNFWCVIVVVQKCVWFCANSNIWSVSTPINVFVYQLRWNFRWK